MVEYAVPSKNHVSQNGGIDLRDEEEQEREMGIGLEEPKPEPMSTGQVWGQLRTAWKNYKIAKVQHDTRRMKIEAEKIRGLQANLGVPQSTFNTGGSA